MEYAVAFLAVAAAAAIVFYVRRVHSRVVLAAEIERAEDLIRAVHEAGHTLVAWHAPECFRVKGVTIMRDVKPGASGVTFIDFAGTVDRQAPQFRRQYIRVLAAGRIAQQLLLGRSFGGEDDDFGRLMTEVVVLMTGMAPEELVRLPESEQIPLRERVAIEGSAIADALYEETAAFLRSRQDVLRHLAEALRHRKTLLEMDLERLLGDRLPLFKEDAP